MAACEPEPRPDGPAGSAPGPRPELTDLWIADPPERWAALGFHVDGDRLTLGGVALHLGAEGDGITAWALKHMPTDPAGAIDGLRTLPQAADDAGAALAHPNTALALDHVVVVTPDFDRTTKALAGAGLEPRRIRDAGTFRQAFRRVGPAILEVVEAREAPAGPARFWGLVVIVADLQALAARLGEHLGEVKDAVQPGRHIATLRKSAGLSPRVAFMDPE